MSGNCPYIIAEAAQGYEGSLDIARLLIKGAAQAKADAIKFQVVFADDLAEPGYQYYELFKQLEMQEATWQEIRQFAASLKIDFVVDVFGYESLKIAKAIDVDAFKLHSTTFFDEDLAQNALALNKPTYISVGGIEIDEIRAFVARHKLTQREDITILFGYQAEPTPLDKNNLARIGALRSETGLNVGFMDHAEAGGPDALTLSVLTLGTGVRIFEKHITLDRAVRLEDYISGLTPSEFSVYVKALKRLSDAFGSASLDLTDEELVYRGKALKRVVAARAIAAGELITLQDIRLSRPAKPGGSYKPKEVLGRRLLKAVKEGEPIDVEVLEP